MVWCRLAVSGIRQARHGGIHHRAAVAGADPGGLSAGAGGGSDTRSARVAAVCAAAHRTAPRRAMRDRRGTARGQGISVRTVLLPRGRRSEAGEGVDRRPFRRRRPARPGCRARRPGRGTGRSGEASGVPGGAQPCARRRARSRGRAARGGAPPGGRVIAAEEAARASHGRASDHMAGRVCRRRPPDEAAGRAATPARVRSGGERCPSRSNMAWSDAAVASSRANTTRAVPHGIADREWQG